jgi:predicted component of type VI protein secretion system
MGRAPNHFGLLQRLDGHVVAGEVEDVVEHLGHLLNCKRDYSSFISGLGLSISDQMWSARPMNSLAVHIREQIARFEPRLSDVRIEPDSVDDPFCPSFRIYGTIGRSAVRLSLSLHTVYCKVVVSTEE